MQSRPILIIGAGGHAKVVAGCLLRGRYAVLGLLDAASERHGQKVLGLSVLGDDDLLRNYAPGAVELANGLGSVGDVAVRRNTFERLKAAGYHFVSVIDDTAFVAPDAVLGEGAQVMAGAVVQVGVSLGHNAIVNSRAVVEHDCRVGAHCHIAPGAVLSGGVQVGVGVHLGAGAVVIQNTSLGEGCVIGAGAVVLHDVSPGQRVAGVPARPINVAQGPKGA